MAPKRGWCKHCQDDYGPGDVIVRCTSCPRTFHKECLEHDLLTNSTYSVYYQNNPENPLDLTDFTCDTCQQYAQESEIVNDERCKICRERNRDESDVLLLCDGCPNSYHMSCLDLQVEPDNDKWYCPMCKPEAFEGVNVRMQRRNPLLDTAEHVNSSICYVCQRHGKLLGCDFCSNSFHYDCLPEFDIDTIADVWECPCCRGEDPFINQMHKRWTISQIEKNSKTRRKCILTWRGVITRYRNRFILAHREELTPFVTKKIIEQLMRSFMANRSKSKNRTVDVLNQLELLQDEQLVESNKFVIKARKSAYYPSGRKKDNRPMRAGVSLKAHQEDGVDWLLKSFLTGGAILADEMGLGKTIQTLCFLSYLKMMNIEGPHLIVVPLSTVGNWLREIHRFTPHLTVVKICGSRTERVHAMSDRLSYNGLYDLFVTTYETVKCEEAFFVETIPRWQCLILDEAHRIKNQSGALRHSMDRIVSNMRLLLTGTPLQNNAQELFTLINFMFPDLFRDSQIMEQAFNVKKRIRNEDEMNFTNEQLESIKLLLSRIMLRRLKEQAISLPKKIFHDVWIPLSQETLKWYRTLMNIRSLMKDNLSIKKLLGIVIKMRIVCGHPRGIVSRTQQLDKLYEFFKQEEVKVQKKIEDDANELKNMKGLAHIHASAKLTFLDKLLCQLHFENCTLVPQYYKTYNQHLRALDHSLYRQMTNASHTQMQVDGPTIKKYTNGLKDGPDNRKLMAENLKSFLGGGAGDAATKDNPGALMLTKNTVKQLKGETKDFIKREMDNSMDMDRVEVKPAQFNEPFKLNSFNMKQEGSGVVPVPVPPDFTQKLTSHSLAKEYEAQLAKSRFENLTKSVSFENLIKKESQDSASLSNPALPLQHPSVMANPKLEPAPDAASEASEATEASYSVDNADAASETKDKPFKKPRKKRLTKDEVLSRVQNEFVRIPANTSETPLYLSDSLKEVNLAKSCPYVSMRIYEKALEQEDNFKKNKKKLVYKFESTNLLEASAEEPMLNLVNDPNKRTSKIIESDEEFDMAPTAEDDSQPAQTDADTTPSGPNRAAHTKSNKKSDEPSEPEAKLNMHKVLVFTQFQLVLDELETYCVNRGWKYMRLDGSTNKLIRELDIREFNNPNSNYFVYLISTRAGGLGINLTAANHVVLYDEDWNPFIDLQAIDRAHRIGQKRNVHIWKLISEWTVEERMALIREKKLQLDKLILHNSFNQQDQNAAEKSGGGEDQDVAASTDPDARDSGKLFDEEELIISLSHAAILKMMMHGNKALQYLDCEKIVDLKLNQIVDRKRKLPPQHLDDTNDIVEDILISKSNQVEGDDRVIIQLVKEEDDMEITQDDPDTSTKKKKLSGMLMKDLINEEDINPEDGASDQKSEKDYEMYEKENEDDADVKEDESTEDTADTRTDQFPEGRRASLRGLGKTNRSKMAMEMEQAGLLWRSGRERKKPSMIYTPIEWHRKSDTRVLRHETKCFICGKPKFFKTTYKDKDDNEVEVDYGELVKCFRCPKVYHKFCERLTSVKRTWSCRWHECCLCFRKSSQCGNLLIHCSNCPTAFCYDCFPPDYTRHYVSDDYYYNLNQRGLLANTSNWIFFLCSKCKIESERSKRSLSGEDRDKQKKEQKQLRSEILSTLKIKADQATTKESRRMKAMLSTQNRKRVEDLKLQEQQLEERHRQLYQGLFPINLIAELKNRINNDILNQESGAGDDLASLSPDVPHTKAKLEKHEREIDKNDEDWGVGLRVKKRGLNFSNVKLPHKLLQFCENCRIPLHNIYKYPTPCPFPKEYVRLDVEINVKKPKGQGAEGAGSPEVGPADQPSLSPDKDPQEKKVIKKCYCSLCYAKNGHRNVHMRRHCEYLGEEEKEEYRERLEKVERAMELLTKLMPTTSNSIDYSQFNNIKLKALYNHMLDQCDSLYLKALINVGLLPATEPAVKAVVSTPEPHAGNLGSRGSGSLLDPIQLSESPPEPPKIVNNYVKSFSNVYKLHVTTGSHLPFLHNDHSTDNPS